MLSLAKRYLRLGDGYGPMTLPQGNGAPSPPSGSATLFDWDPSWDPYVDRVGGIALTPSGTAPTLSVTNGLTGMTFGGSGGLLGSSPITSIDDVTGDRVTLYVVAEFTGAGTTATRGLVGAYDDSAIGVQIDALSAYMIESSNAIVAASADDTAPTEFDFTSLTRNTVQVYVVDASLTTLGIGVDAAPAGPTTLADPPHNPANLDKFAIGGSGTFISGGASPWSVAGWVGNIYRVLVVAGAYDTAVETYLASLYQ